MRTLNPDGYATTPEEAQKRHIEKGHKANTARGDFLGHDTWETCSTIACEQARILMNLDTEVCPTCEGSGLVIKQGPSS